MSFPWPRASATGVGSYPGGDAAAAVRTVFDELPDLPHLPELPDRGPGADLAGRAAALLIDLPVELRPSGWRFADRPGRDLRRAHDHLARDLDALEELAGAYEGPFKIQVCGPWTLAASIELAYGDRTLKDPGAVRDLTASLAEGIAAHVAEVRRRVPGAAVLLQLDEPGLPAVLSGTVPTASGFGKLAAVEEQIAEEGLREVIQGVAGDGATLPTIVHCCAPDVPYAVLRRAGAAAVSADMSLLSARADDAVGEIVEAGVGLFLGVVPAAGAGGTAPGPGLPGVKETAEPVRELWRRLGFAAERLSEQVVLTPACGLAGASPGYVRAALSRCRDAARMLYETAG
ncbi:MAG TPA: methionine synthase [Streptosporangiaceae bacterium]|nr:methionine synthase [Streptosporangiaceae bacterium]